jgi:hypothetical protein
MRALESTPLTGDVDWKSPLGSRSTWARLREQTRHCTFYRTYCFKASLKQLEEVTEEHVTYVGDCAALPPSPFLCVLLAYDCCSPSREEVAAHLDCSKNVYWRAIVATWIRWKESRAEQVYQLLDPLYRDYRPIKVRQKDNSYHNSYLDVFIDQLLRYRCALVSLEEPFVLDVIPFPHLPQRYELEARGVLPQREYAAPEDGDDDDDDDDAVSRPRLQQ